MSPSSRLGGHSVGGLSGELFRFIKLFRADHMPEGTVRSEVLAEALRQEYALGPFPKLEELNRLLDKLGIHRKSLDGGPLPGANVWAGTGRPTLLLRSELSPRRAETTIAHELREIIENALKRLDPEFVARDTRDNRVMHSASERFGGYLLMQTKPTIQVFENVGFDPLTVSRGLQRSLPSVVMRMQTLFAADYPGRAPKGGFWWYEPDGPDFPEPVVKFVTVTKGFSLAGGGPPGLNQIGWLPSRQSLASDHPTLAAALRTGQSSSRVSPRFDLWGEEKYVEIAEPLLGGSMPRALLSVIHQDSSRLIELWLRRLSRT